MADAPLEVFYWPTPNGFKVTIMLEELGVPYKVMFVNILAGDQFKEDFLKISPNNRMPAIIDPQGPGGKPISIFESGAILQYLGRKYGRFYPEEERARVAVEEWLFWQVGDRGDANQSTRLIGVATLGGARAKFSSSKICLQPDCCWHIIPTALKIDRCPISGSD